MRRTSVLAVLLIGAAYTPARVVALNVDKFPHPERILLIVAAYFAVGLAWYALLRRGAMKQEASLLSCLALLLLISSGQRIATVTSTLVAVSVALGLAIAIALISNRVGDQALRVMTIGSVVFLVAGPALALVEASFGSSPQSIVMEPTSSIPTAIESGPDVFVVVLDGFPGPTALTEVYQSDLAWPEEQDVRRLDAWASYPMTIASVSSLFEMGYPLEDGDIVDKTTAAELSQIMSGDNRFNALLKESGYVITHVESGYSNSYCHDTVDVCVSSAFLDEGTFWILNQSVIGQELRQRAGSAFTQGSLHTMTWLNENLPSLASNQTTDFVFASVLAPHPPLMLNESCDLTYEFWRVGNSVYAGDAIVSERQEAFIDQAQCISTFESRLLQEIPSGALTIFVSDHGGDSLGQMSKYGRVWSDLDTIERLNTHLAIKSSLDCELTAPVLLPEILRDLLWCFSGSSDSEPESPERIHTASRIEDTSFYALDELSAEEMRRVGVGG